MISDSRHGDEETDGGMGRKTVLAAGCVLWRCFPESEGIEIALVHRPKYDDWSHPKGKLKRGEEPLDAAVREVLEETGMRCVPGEPLPAVHYLVDGRPKTVHYWAAEAMDDDFVPNSEVDRLLWLAPAVARERLTQAHDRPPVDAALAVLPLSRDVTGRAGRRPPSRC